MRHSPGTRPFGELGAVDPVGAAGIAQALAHVVQQQVAVDPLDLAERRRVAGRAADLGEEPAPLPHVLGALRPVRVDHRPARAAPGRRPPVRRTRPRSGRVPSPCCAGRAARPPANGRGPPGRARWHSAADELVQAGDLRLPAEPADPALRRAADPAPDVRRAGSPATATSTSDGIASIWPAPNRAGVFRSAR